MINADLIRVGGNQMSQVMEVVIRNKSIAIVHSERNKMIAANTEPQSLVVVTKKNRWKYQY